MRTYNENMILTIQTCNAIDPNHIYMYVPSKVYTFFENKSSR